MKKILVLVLGFCCSQVAYSSMWDVSCTQGAIQNEFGSTLKGKFGNPIQPSSTTSDLEIFFYAFNSSPVFHSKKISDISSTENTYDGIGLVQVWCEGDKVVAYNIFFNNFLKNTDKTTLGMLNKKYPKKFKLIHYKHYDKNYEIDVRENNDSYIARLIQPIYDDSASFLYLSKSFFSRSIKESAEMEKKEKEKEIKKDKSNIKKANSVLP